MSETNGYATNAILQQAYKRRFKDHEVAGLKFRLRSLNAREIAAIQQKAKDDMAVNIYLIIAACVDGEGNPISGDADYEKWLDQDTEIIASLANACIRHTGISAFSEDSAKN